MITLKLLDSIKDISKKINISIAESLNDKLTKNEYALKTKAKNIVFNLIQSQPEIASLNGGKLQGAFGIIDPSSAISAIIKSIADSIDVKFTKFNDKLKGGISINIQPSSFENLLNLSQGFVNYKNSDLHWLNWLLTQGDKIIIINYQYNAKTGLGRSGLGNMIPGDSFRVPPEFSGSQNNNFITRAFLNSSAEKQFIKILEEALS